MLSITCKVLSVKGTQLLHVHFQPHLGGKGGGGGGISCEVFFGPLGGFGTIILCSSLKFIVSFTAIPAGVL